MTKLQRPTLSTAAGGNVATVLSDVYEDQQSYVCDWDGFSVDVGLRKDSADLAVLREARETHFAELFQLRSGQKVLDAGCGHGDYTAYALRLGCQVWAFDNSNQMVEYTRNSLQNEELIPESLEVCSVLDLPYPDESFDAVFCLSVLDHIADRDEALRQLVRVLKPGGHLYIDVSNKWAYHWRLGFKFMRMLGMYPSGKIHAFAPGELKEAICEADCEPKDWLGLGFCPPFSGLYTADMRRITFLPEFIIKPLDRLFLSIERMARRYVPLRWMCWHHVVRAVKVAKPVEDDEQNNGENNGPRSKS